MSNRWRQIEELYHAALARPAEERGALLAGASPEVRSEVEELLAQPSTSTPLDRAVINLLAGQTITQFTAGAHLGPYQIEGPLGSGGMGQVYRARDTRLGRAVAIKMSAQEFNDRFGREARAISALNHPNICTLYDVGPNYLVMELVEGETLAEHLKKGPLPIELLLRYGVQIASALAAAHASGIIHRDLKPANIMVTKGTVKVLDFGLAKSSGDENLTASHVVMGTPAYMAPEQREGKECDARTDVYALGLVLCEMAMGKRFPAGEKPVLDGVPFRVARVIERCLESDRETRWQSAHDLKLELAWAEQAEPEQAPKSASPRWVWAAGVAAVLVLVAMAFMRMRSAAESPRPQTVRFRIPMPEGLRLPISGSFSLSPDGKTLVYLAAKADGVLRLWAQPLDSFESHELPGADVVGADSAPFWSPNSQFLVFYSGGKLKKTDLRGSPPQTICTTPGVLIGGSWDGQGVVIFGRENGGLMRAPEHGGEAIPLTSLDRTRSERVHGFPLLLPDGHHFLYSRFSTIPENSGIYVGSLDANPADQGLKQLVATPVGAQFIPLLNGTGRLLFLRDDTLWAQDLDTSRFNLTGEPVRVVDHVGHYLGGGSFAASAGGALAYRNATGAKVELTWFDRSGKVMNSGDAPIESEPDLALSPDGTRATIPRFEGGSLNLWMYDLGRKVIQPLTSGPNLDINPVWSHDGKSIVYSSGREGHYDLYRIPASGEGQAEPLYQSGDSKFVTSVSSDDSLLLFHTQSAAANADIWVLPLSGPGKGAPVPLLQTRANERSGTFSPDTRWIAYASDETGVAEIYVQPFKASSPALGGPKTLVSKGGGSRPRWRGDGKELFYSSPDDTLMSVAVIAGSAFQPGISKPLFHMHSVRAWDATVDGNRFLMAIPVEQAAPQPISIVLGWEAGLTR